MCGLLFLCSVSVCVFIICFRLFHGPELNLSLNWWGNILSKASQSSYMFQFCSQSPNCPLPVVVKHVYHTLLKGDAGPGDKNEHVSVSLHAAGFSREKSVLSWSQLRFNRKNIEVRQLCSLKMALNIFKRGILMRKPYQNVKEKNMKHFVI